jgi:hypothetical protein
MRLRPSLLLLGALFLAAGMARAVDRGQFENVPGHNSRLFKGVRNLEGAPCCDTGYQSTACGGRCRRRRSFETPVSVRRSRRLVCQPPRQYRNPLLRAADASLEACETAPPERGAGGRHALCGFHLETCGSACGLSPRSLRSASQERSR